MGSLHNKPILEGKKVLKHLFTQRNTELEGTPVKITIKLYPFVSLDHDVLPSFRQKRLKDTQQKEQK